jgi:dTDP-4-amino-4,6-dideoxygalactose transaminase
VFESEEMLLKIKKSLSIHQINTRRYFFPSLNELPYLQMKQSCPISENISRRVLCLPLYPDLESKSVENICSIIKKELTE